MVLIEHNWVICVFIIAHLCLDVVIQGRYKCSDAIDSAHTYRQPCTHCMSTRAEESSFSKLIITMLYYCMPGEASVPLSNAEEMRAESSMRQSNTLFGCMMSS